MRIWSIHPKYLDTKGLVALWRETLLAKRVLEGKTKGYRNHPQLDRFKLTDKPIDRINQYLATIYNEALSRNYNFDKEKIDWNFKPSIMRVTTGQIKFETEHLLNKLKIRDKKKFSNLNKLKKIDQHPIFKIIKGDIEDWEIT
ncbi:MAG: pyrimidine dimer DNA glycosylase/endonuclease V [Chitinophagaceae bacterium]|nr:pyrimidine dimer DNA glycosylase/endonuclease V [Chitinophagaceae bacterium]